MSAGGASAPGPSGLGNAALEAMHEEEALGKAYDARLLRRLWPYVRPYWMQVVLTVLMVGPIFLLEIAPAWIVKTGLDRIVAPEVRQPHGVDTPTKRLHRFAQRCDGHRLGRGRLAWSARRHQKPGRVRGQVCRGDAPDVHLRGVLGR